MGNNLSAATCGNTPLLDPTNPHYYITIHGPIVYYDFDNYRDYVCHAKYLTACIICGTHTGLLPHYYEQRYEHNAKCPLYIKHTKMTIPTNINILCIPPKNYIGVIGGNYGYPVRSQYKIPLKYINRAVLPILTPFIVCKR